MSYKALYRSYRPQTFEEVAGQEHIVTTLKNAIKENRIGHAYLFHPDVIEIDAASNNGVDEVRDLIDKVKYAPINGKYKVYIIDEVHMMSPGAFNALLKTLEEPPAHIVFILATTEPHKILPTIISRCQRFDFKKVDDHDIVERLEFVLKSEQKKYDLKALELVAKLADGGMRDALSILEQCLAFNNELTVANVNEVYGLLSMDNKIKFIKQLLSKDIKGVLESLENMLSGSIDIKRLTFDLIDVLKDIIIYKNTQDISILFVLTKQDVDNLAPYILVEEAFEIIDILIDASSHYSQSVNANTYFELAMLKICNKVKDENKINVEKPPVLQVDHTSKATSIVENDVAKENISVNVQNNNQQEAGIDNQNNVQQQPIIDIQEDEYYNEPINEPDYYPEDLTYSEEVNNPIESIEVENTPVKTEKKEIVNVEVSFDDILNILVQAKRTVLNEIKEKWSVIARYRFNLNTAKFASMLCDGTPVAACEGGIIIAFEHQPNVNEVNETRNYHQLKKFLTEVLGESYDFIAVKSSNWTELRNTYIKMMRSGTLPKPQPIVLHHIGDVEDNQPELNDAQALAVELFGDLVEFEE